MFAFSKGPLRFLKGGHYPHCNSVLVDDRFRAVIDAASDRDDLLEFKHQRPVRFLITSHAHEDHLAFNHLFPESTFCAHPLDAPHFEDVKSLADCYGDMPPDALRKWCDFFIKECHYVPRKVDCPVTDGFIFDFGETQMEVVYTPGHTEGHCAFYFPREKVLFTADLDLTRVGPYYADRTSDIESTIRSLKKLKTFPAETYLTGHGKGVYEGNPEYMDRYLRMIQSREDRVIEYLQSGPKTLPQITAEGIIYGKNPSFMGEWDLTISERMMIRKHLERLTGRNRVGREGDYFLLV